MWTPACPSPLGDSRVSPSVQESKFVHHTEAAGPGAVAHERGNVCPNGFTAPSGAEPQRA
jgi:hypothetical protein